MQTALKSSKVRKKSVKVRKKSYKVAKKSFRPAKNHAKSLKSRADLQKVVQTGEKSCRPAKSDTKRLQLSIFYEKFFERLFDGLNGNKPSAFFAGDLQNLINIRFVQNVNIRAARF